MHVMTAPSLSKAELDISHGTIYIYKNFQYINNISNITIATSSLAQHSLSPLFDLLARSFFFFFFSVL